jgi:Tfp pilus assembly protein PilF
MIDQPAPPQAPAASWKQPWQVWVVCSVLAALILVVFAQTLTHQFVCFDDNSYVYRNLVVARGLTARGFVWAFSFHSSNWHPLTWLSHELDCQLYGLNPAGHHLTNLLLHTATATALFLVLRRATGALWRSAFVAAVFAIHPLHVESVAWVAERKDVLSGLFFVLTIAAYIRYTRGANNLKFQISKLTGSYWLVVLLFALGLMSKPMLVTLPLVLLLLDYWPLNRWQVREGRAPASPIKNEALGVPPLGGQGPTESVAGPYAVVGRGSRRARLPWPLFLEKLPLLALSAASCLLTILAQRREIAWETPVSMPDRLANALASCAVYLGQMIWPANLAALYPFPYNGIPVWETAVAGTLLAGISVLVWKRRQARPWLLVGWLWYLIMLLPVLGFIHVGRQAHADRYTYLPQIGIYIALTWLVTDFFLSSPNRNRNLNPNPNLNPSLPPSLAASLATAVIAVLTICAAHQATFWHDSDALFFHAVACTKDNDAAHVFLAYICMCDGNPETAVLHFQEALKIRPGNVDALFNYGLALYQEGKLDEAAAQYRKALQVRPDRGDARCNLGNVLARQGKTDEAIAQYEQALQMDPNLWTVHLNLGNALLKKDKPLQALAHYQKAFQLEPDSPSVQERLAWMLATSVQPSQRDGPKALALARQANDSADATDPVFLHTLAAALAETGQFSNAVETAQQALTLATRSNPDLVPEIQSELKLFQAGKPFHGAVPIANHPTLAKDPP